MANASAGSSSKWLNATHIGGAPGTTVTPRWTIDSTAVAGSKRCTSSTVAPTVSDDAEHDVEPEDVEQRQDAVHDVVRSRVIARRQTPARCWRAGCRG